MRQREAGLTVRRIGRALGMTVPALLTALCAAGCGAPARTAPHVAAMPAAVQGAARTMAAGHCPSSAPRSIGGGSGEGGALVPSDAERELVICRYPGAGASPGDRMVPAVVRAAGSVASLGGQIDALPVTPQGVRHCPMDDGSSALLAFLGSGDHRVLLRAGLRGCPTITDGRAARDLSPQVLDRVLALAG